MFDAMLFGNCLQESAASANIATEKIKQTAEQLKKATGKIGETVSETLKGAAENEFVKGSKEKVNAVFLLVDTHTARNGPVKACEQPTRD